MQAMKPSDFEDLFWKEVGMSRVVASTKEGRICGVKQRALQDLLLSRTVPLKQTNLAPGSDQSVIAPWVYRPKRWQVNANYWEVEAGEANAEAGSGTIPASAWDLTIVNSSGQFASDLPAIEKYFLPGRFIIVLYVDPVTGVGRRIQMRVISATNADSGGTYKAIVTCYPNIATDTWATYTSDQKAPYQPTHGLVIPLTNSVSQYESWCYNDTAEIPLTLKAVWFQTMRRTHCYTDQYVKAIEAPLLDPLFKKFRLMPIVQQKKRQAELAQMMKWNSVFFGREINDHQTVETYDQLEEVRDPANTGCVLEYKANTLGIVKQLEDCCRVVDFAGAAMDFDLLQEALYTLHRYRQTEDIDAFTDRYTASNIHTMMIQYYKDKYGYELNRFFNIGQPIKFDNQVLWNYNTYDFPEAGTRLHIIHDPFFDDHLSAMPTADKSMGRYFMMLDWSDIEIGLSQAKSVTRKTNEADALYNCVVTPVITQYQLYSETFAVDVNDPNRHLIYTNFSDECPSITSSPCEPNGYAYTPYPCTKVDE